MIDKYDCNYRTYRFRTHRFRESRDRNCMVCNMRVRETLDHLFVECPAYEQARDGAAMLCPSTGTMIIFLITVN